MLEKLQNSLKYLSVVSLSLGLYSHLKNLNKITSELFNERNKLDILNKKYEDLLKNKINENEMEKIISNEKIKLLMEDMNLLKSKLTNQNSINESKLENINNDNILEQLSDVNQTFKETNNKIDSFINVIEKYLNSKNNNFTNLFSDSFTTLINDLNNIIHSLTIEQNLALISISASIFILVTMFSIISVFYGDYLINILNLERKYTKLAKIIQIRRKFRQYYLLLNILGIIIMTLIIITINIHYYFL